MHICVFAKSDSRVENPFNFVALPRSFAMLSQAARQTGGHVRERVHQTVPAGKSGLHTGGDRGSAGMGQGDESVGRHRDRRVGHEEDLLHRDRRNDDRGL